MIKFFLKIASKDIPRNMLRHALNREIVVPLSNKIKMSYGKKEDTKEAAQVPKGIRPQEEHED